MTLRTLLIVTLFPAAATAAEPEPGFAVFPLQHAAPVTDAQASGVRAALASAVSDALPLSEVDRKLAAVDTNCTTPTCLERAGKLLGARKLVGGRLEKESDNWTLSLWLFDAEARATLATVRDQCGGCSQDQANDWAKRVVATLLEKVESTATARVDVRSTPPGAEVAIDGSTVGVTDMTFGVEPGHHSISVQLPGYALELREIDVTAGATVKVEVQLNPTTDAAAPAPGGSRLVRVAKWVTLGLAVASLATGIILMAMDGAGTCDTSFPGEECPELRATMAPGVSLVAVGTASAIASGYFFYKDRNRDTAAAALPAGMGTGAGFGVTLRFP